MVNHIRADMTTMDPNNTANNKLNFSRGLTHLEDVVMTFHKLYLGFTPSNMRLAAEDFRKNNYMGMRELEIPTLIFKKRLEYRHDDFLAGFRPIKKMMGEYFRRIGSFCANFHEFRLSARNLDMPSEDIDSETDAARSSREFRALTKVLRREDQDSIDQGSMFTHRRREYLDELRREKEGEDDILQEPMTIDAQLEYDNLHRPE